MRSSLVDLTNYTGSYHEVVVPVARRIAMSDRMTFLRRLHRDPLIGLRGRPRHWIQKTARELSGSPVPKKSQPTPNSPILQRLPPLPEGLGYGLDLR
eukprot:COSAG01_NODE_21411_length_903_cov_1.493781_2_plen_96_part_01